VSADGSLIVGFTTSPQSDLVPSFWSGGALSALATQGMSGIARDISPNGLYVGGSTNFFDRTIYDTINQATLWVDDDLAIAADQTASDYRMVLLTDAQGNPFDGEVYAVSDNGYAVGRANAYNPDAGQKGFIWHESFAGVRLFDEWLFAEYGITLPTPSIAINDVFFDGLNLSFAVLGSAYFVTVPPKDPTCEPPGPSFDVNRDGFITALDVLLVINDINSKGTRSLSPCYFNEFPNGPFVDVNADGFVSPADVLDTINYINSQIVSGRSEGEAAATLIDAVLAAGQFSLPNAPFSLPSPSNLLPLSSHAAAEEDSDPLWCAIEDEPPHAAALVAPKSSADSSFRDDLFADTWLDLQFPLESQILADLAV